MAPYDVPFVSQYADIGNHEWRARGCGIAALRMAMAYWHGKLGTVPLPALDALLAEGIALGAYREGIGWTHRGLVELARRHGLDGYNADFAQNGPTPKSARDAFDELSKALEHGPVLASVFSGMDPDRGGGHIVVVTGSGDGVVSFSDPEELGEREGRKAVSTDAFLKAFKRRYIVISPHREDSESHRS